MTVLVGAAAAAVACSSKGTVDLRSPGQWPATCLQPNVICSAGEQTFGDGGTLRDASFSVPESIAFDSTGNLFVADEDDQRIRRVDAATGIVTTVVGDGNEGEPTAGALATSTNLAKPDAVAVCPDGWLVFEESGGTAVWGLDPATGQVQVVTGDPANGGPAIDDVPADQARYAFTQDVSALSCDARNVLVIADTNNSVIRALARGASPVSVGGLTVQPGQVRIVAGVAGAGNTPGPDGPDARASQLGFPLFAQSLGDGRVLVSDDGSSRVRLVTAAGAIRTVVNAAQTYGNDGDGGLGVDAGLSSSPGCVSDGTRVFITARDEVRLLNLSSSSSVSYGGVVVGPSDIDELAGSLDHSTLTYPWGDGGAALGQPIDIDLTPPVLSPSGEVWFAQPSEGVLRKVDAAGKMTVAGGYGSASGPADFIAHPDDLATARDGGLLMTARDGRVWRLPPGATAFQPAAGDGSPTPGPDGVLATNGGMVPTAIAPAPDGSLYVFDTLHHSLRVVDPHGRIETLSQNDYLPGDGNGGALRDAYIDTPEAAVYADGILYWQEDVYGIRAANLTASTVTLGTVSIAPGNVDLIAGAFDNMSDSGDVPALQAHFNFGEDGSQMFVLDGKLWIDDGYHGLIRTLDLRTGIVHTVNDQSDDSEGTLLAHLYLPGSRGMALHDGWLYFTAGDDRIRRARLPDGPVETVAGGALGTLGDGGIALTAELAGAGDLAVTPDGVVWVTEWGHRIRRIQPGGLP